MPLTATFAADFADFTRAIDGAEVKLQVFERATKNASRGVTRALEDISGQKVAVEAARMAEAVKRLGGEGGTAAGLLKLTDDELRRLENTMGTAARKAELLGEELPDSLRQIQSEMAKLPKSAEGASTGIGVLDATFGRLTASFAAATLIDRAITGIFSIGSAAIESAGELVDLNASTRVSIETLQRWGQVAKLGGIQLDDMTSASFRLSDAVAGGGRSVQKAVALLGLSFADLQDLAPEAQMDAILRAAEALGPVQERNTAFVDLFGSKGAQALTRIVDGYGGTIAAANAASDAQIRAIDRAADRWDKFVDDTLTNAKSVLGGLVENLERGGAGPLTGPNGEFIPELAALEEQRRAEEAAAAAVTAQAEQEQAARQRQAASTRDFVRELAALQETLEALTPAQREQLDAAIRLGASAEDITAKFGLGEEAQRLYAATTKETGKAMSSAAAEAEAYARSLDALSGRTALADAAKALDQLQDVGGSLKVVGSQLDTLRRRFIAGAEAARQLGDVELAEFYAGVAQELTPLSQLQDRYNVTVGQFVPVSDDYTQAVIDQFEAMTDLDTIYVGILPNVMDLTKAMEGLKEPLQPNDIAEFGQTFESAVADMGISFVTIMTDASQDAGDRMQAIMGSVFQGIASAAGAIIGGALGGPGGAQIGAQIGNVVGRAFRNELTVQTERALVEMEQRVRTAADDILRGSDRFQPDTDTSGQDLASDWLNATNAIINASRDQFEAYEGIADRVREAQEEIDKLNEVEARGRGVEWAREMEKAQNDLTAALTEQHAAGEGAAAELENLGRIAMGAYAAAIEAGMSHNEALRAAGPGLTQIAKAYENLGLNVEDAGLKAFLAQANFAATNPEILAGIDGLTQSMSAMSSIGLLNADTFAAMQEAGGRMYERLLEQAQAYGLEGDEATRAALLPMQEYLRQAAEEAERLGVPLDENTQKLIDQSKAMGIWKDKGKEPMEEMLDVMTEMRDVLKEFVDNLRGMPRSVDTTVTTKYRQEGTPPSGTGGPTNTTQPSPTPTPTVTTSSSRPSSLTVNTRLEVDGRVLAEATVPYIPDALDRAGV